MSERSDLKALRSHRCLDEAIGDEPHFTQIGKHHLVKYIRANHPTPYNFKFYSEKIAREIAEKCGSKFSVQEGLDGYFRIIHNEDIS